MKFSIKDFFSKWDQIRSFLRIWSDLLKKSLMKNFIFVQWSVQDLKLVWNSVSWFLFFPANIITENLSKLANQWINIT